jgi:hypothetical protein
MALERIDLANTEGVRRKIAHATVGEPHFRYCRVAVGELTDRRFFAERVGMTAQGKPGSAAYVFYSEEQAIRLADRWIMDGRRWERVPAVWDGFGKPADEAVWHQVGNRWVLGAAPEDTGERG